jgi:hypothetical protein
MSDPATSDEDRLIGVLLSSEERLEQGRDVPAAELCPERPDLVPLSGV